MRQDPIICVSGSDGTGKSTLVAALCRAMPEARPVSIWDLMAEPQAQQIFTSKAMLHGLLGVLGPDSRALLCASGLKAAFERAPTGLRIVDSHWYKFMATELALGADPALVATMARAFDRPLLTLQVSLSPRRALERKQGDYSAYECGLEAATPENFVAFQSRASALVEKLAAGDSHRVLTLDGSGSPGQVLGAALAALDQALPSILGASSRAAA